jgi:DNA repair photolyase
VAQIEIKGRGAGFNPQNRFEELHVDYYSEDVLQYFDIEEDERKIPTRFYLDTSKSILAKNDSPDLGFDYSINPYRGCEHGCIYCYARPSHEYLGFSSGIDFETKIMVKMDAPQLLDKTFQDEKWKPQVICFSGNTDCYQPAEKKLELTRQCLEVFLKYRNPVSIITKNALIQRDIHILKELALLELVEVVISITTLHGGLVKKMEPRTSAPHRRLDTIELLAKNKIPVGVNVAPIIPGLTDEEVPRIIKEASLRGATFAGNQLLRLPYAVKELFRDWLKKNFPERESKIIKQIRDTRGGKLSDSEFGTRMTGSGHIASAIRNLFEASCKKYGLNKTRYQLRADLFFRKNNIQTELFR